MDKNRGKQSDEIRNRPKGQTGSNASLRRTSRTRRVPREYAEYFNEIHSKGLKHDLLKKSQIIEASTEYLKNYDYNNIETMEIEQTLETIRSNWVNYLEKYEEYSRLVDNSRDLERVSIQRQSLERKINVCNQIAIVELNKSIRSLKKGSKLIDDHQLRNDDKLSVSVHSSISMSRSSKSRHSTRSSVSSRANAAARSAQLAKLKLEQAEKRAKSKQKQMQEQIEQELQDLRDQLEYSQLEAKLLADQAEERNCDYGSKNGSSKSVASERADVKVELSSPSQRRGAVCEIDHPSTSSEFIKTLPEQVMCDKQSVTSLPKTCEQSKPPLPESSSDDENTKQEVTAALLQMNQQLVSAMKQGNETTTVMKAILQRQGIPKPEPTKFRGDPAKFPVFKKRVDAWLNERDFDEREKITRLLSFVEGDARDAIEHCELKSNGYSEAMKILETQYGHPSSVVKASLTRITSGPRIEKGDKDALTKLRNNLRAGLEVLKDNENYEHEINASSNVERVIDRLPMHMQIGWVKKVPKIRDETKLNPTLQHVMEFVERQLRSMNDPQYGHILTAKKKPIDGNNFKRNNPNVSSKKPLDPALSKPISTLTTNL